MIPKAILKDGYQISRKSTLYGVHLDLMTRKELISLCAYGWNEYNNQINTITVPMISEVEKRKADK